MLGYKKLPTPILLVIILACVVLFGHYLSSNVQATFYAISLTIKEVLLFVLPFIIFSLLFGSIVNLYQGALRLILLILPMVCLSNFITTFVGYFVGMHFLAQDTTLAQVGSAHAADLLQPLWEFQSPRWVPNQYALLIGLITGLYFNFFAREKGKVIAQYLNHYAIGFLRRVFIPIIPLFVMGFVLKLQHDGVLTLLMHQYSKVLLIIGGTLLAYLFFLYGLAAGFRPTPWVHSIYNVSGAIVAGFSTMSSAASMPLSVIAAERNTHNQPLARFAIPTTVNIHLIGDCISIPILSLAIMISFNQPLPDIATFATFAGYMVLAKFAVAAVPGGGVLVILPIVQQHLHFSSEMMLIITALYILFDPFITGANVTGNGAFAILFHRVNQLINKLKLA